MVLNTLNTEIQALKQILDYIFNGSILVLKGVLSLKKRHFSH